MNFIWKSSAASIARILLGIVAAFLIKNSLTDENAANDFASNNVELVAGILIAVVNLVWVIAQKKFANTAFWQAIFAPQIENPEKIVEKAADESGLPKFLRF